MLMVAWPRREFSIAQRAQFAAQDLFGDRDAILIEHPLREIDQPPAHDAMDRRGRIGLDHGDERTPLVVIELGRMPGRLTASSPRRLNLRPRSRTVCGPPRQQSRVRARAAA